MIQAIKRLFNFTEMKHRGDAFRIEDLDEELNNLYSAANTLDQYAKQVSKYVEDGFDDNEEVLKGLEAGIEKLKAEIENLKAAIEKKQNSEIFTDLKQYI